MEFKAVDNGRFRFVLDGSGCTLFAQLFQRVIHPPLNPTLIQWIEMNFDKVKLPVLFEYADAPHFNLINFYPIESLPQEVANEYNKSLEKAKEGGHYVFYKHNTSRN